MFQYTDAFIYGYLVGLNINIPTNRNFGNGNFGRSDIFVSEKGGGFGSANNVEKGRGGGTRGENGKPMPSDTKSPGKQLCGAGGIKNGGGTGGNSGIFGYGGNASNNLSAGGGGGWFGGASSIVHAGGGGGSGFVWSEEWKSSVPSDYDVPEEYMSTEYETHIGNNYGHGYCSIEEPSGRVASFGYTGRVQEYITPVEGDYTITCLGAQGGTIDESQEVTIGGLGGTTIAKFHLPADLTLYVYVGQEGNVGSPNRPFGGGGYGRGGCSDGGGATDVRLTSNLNSRIIVAGGGGGVGSILEDGDILNDKDYEDMIDKDPNADLDNEDTQTGVFDLGYVLISDLSILHWDAYYLASEDTEDIINYKVFVDGEQWFERDSAVKKGGGFHNEEWYFWEVLPPYTPEYWAHVVVQIEFRKLTIIPLSITQSNRPVKILSLLNDEDIQPIPEPEPGGYKKEYGEAESFILFPENSIKVWIETLRRNQDRGNHNYERPLLVNKSRKIFFDDDVFIKIAERASDVEIIKKSGIIINDSIDMKSIEYQNISKDEKSTIIIDDDYVIDDGSEKPIIPEDIKQIKKDRLVINDNSIINIEEVVPPSTEDIDIELLQGILINDSIQTQIKEYENKHMKQNDSLEIKDSISINTEEKTPEQEPEDPENINKSSRVIPVSAHIINIKEIEHKQKMKEGKLKFGDSIHIKED